MNKLINKGHRGLCLAMLSLLFASIQVKAQQNDDSALVVRNQIISIDSGGLVFVDGGVHVNVVDAANTILNKGTIELIGNWTNASATTKAFDPLSTGYVLMSGGLQYVKGIGVTRFPNLKITGTAKKVLNINSEIANILDLTDLEFDVNNNTLTVQSTDPDAIIYDQGYVNTTSGSYATTSPRYATDGWLIRATTKNTTYVYPLGNDIRGDLKLRPLEITALNDGDVYAQFLNYNPLENQYDPQKLWELNRVNKMFYHGVKFGEGTTTAQIRVPFNNDLDSMHATIAVWDPAVTAMKWKRLPSFDAAYYNFATNTHSILAKASNITLSTTRTNVGLGSDDIAIRVPNVITPNKDGVNDALIIEGLSKYPDSEIKIFNRWGNVVFHSTNYNNDWDARGLLDGTYFYELKLKIANGTKLLKGYVMIIR